MLVHSYLYYRLDDPIIDDNKWQRWANELAELQNNNPDDCNIDFYDKEFENWNGDTGYHLPLKDPKVIKKAMQIKKIWDQCYDKDKNMKVGIKIQDTTYA